MVHPFAGLQALPGRFVRRRLSWNRRGVPLGHDCGFEGAWRHDRTQTEREERGDGLIVLQRTVTGGAAGE